MATSKAFTLFPFALLILLSFLASHSVLAHQSANNEKQSPFGFLKKLQGCHKGDKEKGIHELKKYLDKFGYLNYNSSSTNQINANDDDFDDQLESALKTYQLNYHLKATGVLDAKTVSKMETPRCGMPDIVNGTTSMRSGKKRHHHNGSAHLHTVSHYSFFPQSPRWPPSNYHLTYALRPGTRADAIRPVVRAFETWAANTHFKFTQTRDFGNANIKISFDSGDHGDGYNNRFDGAGGVLAHAFAPTDGRFHYDADETWSVGARQDAFDLETVALHEIGHLLGLGHSSVEGAIMYASIRQGMTKGLHSDDIQGIRALYNV